MVEFAFTAVIFLLFVIIIIELGLFGWRSLTAQYVASRTAREAAIFAGDEGPGNRNVRTMWAYSKDLTERMGVNLHPNINRWGRNNVEICEVRELGAFGTPDAFRCTGTSPAGIFGGPEDFVSVRITIPTRFFLQLITADVVGWAVARNEEHPPTP